MEAQIFILLGPAQVRPGHAYPSANVGSDHQIVLARLKLGKKNYKSISRKFDVK